MKRRRFFPRQATGAGPGGRSVLHAGATILALLLLWEIAVRIWRPPKHVWPALGDVAEVFATKGAVLLANAWATAYETLIGFGLALVVGIAGGILMNTSKRLAQALWPAILFAQMTPKIALAPLLLAWFGFGLLPKIIIAFLITFFPILLSTYTGLRAVEPEKEELARSMRAGPGAYLLRFALPSALPFIFSGARISITLAVIGAIVAEFVGADKGLGQLLLQSATNLDTPLLIAAVLLLGFMGVTLYGAVLLAEFLFIPWHISQRGGSSVAAGEI